MVKNCLPDAGKVPEIISVSKGNRGNKKLGSNDNKLKNFHSILGLQFVNSMLSNKSFAMKEHFFQGSMLWSQFF
jgi:hypothetical protein